MNINLFRGRAFLLSSCVLLSGLTYGQNLAGAVSLNTLDSFMNPSKNWTLAAEVSFDLTRPGKMNIKPGNGVLLTSKSGPDLVLKEEFDDVEIDLDFMLANGSRSGIIVHGYEIALADSRAKLNPTFADMGGIALGGLTGLSPTMNVARAPGLWQHLKIKFKAPRFDANGVKTMNARFEEVTLNGAVIHSQADVTAPQGSEKARGTLVLKGGPGAVAFRNISYRPPVPPQVNTRRNFRTTNPVMLEPGNKPYVLRSFLDFENKKRTHVVSVGSPNGASYSYDLKQGALLQVWRGRFVNVTEMWDGRGEPQLARPDGSVVRLSGAPALAFLADDSAVWPAEIAFDALNNKGYALDSERFPTFKYAFGGVEVADKIVVATDRVIRDITVSGTTTNLYCRIASAKTIEASGDGLYAIDDRSWYVHIDAKFKPMIRKTAAGQELVVSVAKITSPLSYAIIW